MFKKNNPEKTDTVNNNMTILKIVSLVTIFMYSAYYFFTRSYISNIRDYLMLEMCLDANQFSQISSAFSISYSLSQVLMGHIMDRFSLRYILPVLLICSGMSSLLFIHGDSMKVLVYSRYALGIFFSIGSTGSLKYLSIVWKKEFPLLSNALSVFMSLSGALAASSIVKNLMEEIGWRNLLNYYIMAGFVLAIILFFSLKIINFYQVEKKESNNLNFIKSAQVIFKEKSLIYIILYSICISASAYLLMDGVGNMLLKSKYQNLSIGAYSLPGTFNMLGNASGCLYNIFARNMKIKKQMFIHSLINLFAMFFLIFLNPSFYQFIGCCYFIGFSCGGQLVGVQWLAQNINSKYVGLSFGILNFSVMFFGCAIVQRLSGFLLDVIKKSYGNAHLYTSSSYGYEHIIILFRSMFLISIIAQIAVLCIKNKENK